MYENMYNHLHTLWIYRIYAYVYFSLYIYTYIYMYIYIHNIYNVKSGLINPSRLINQHCPFFWNLKTGGPPRLMNTLAYSRLKNHQCWNPFFFSKSFKWFPYGFLMIYIYISWNRMNTRTHHCWSLNIWKNNYSPNDWFLIKFFIKIISLDSSQRVPPMSPCPPLIIIRVCPWLINHHVPNVFSLDLPIHSQCPP